MITYKCDKCGEELDAINMSTMQVTETANLERYELCRECYKKFKEWVAEGDEYKQEDALSLAYLKGFDDGIAEARHRLEPADRDCENCVHHKDNGCESWECKFERR